jgi:hypothetical protein
VTDECTGCKKEFTLCRNGHPRSTHISLCSECIEGNVHFD